MSNFPVNSDSKHLSDLSILNKHDFKKQIELHEKIRNDDDYDDWEYGTEPNYGSFW